MKIISYGFEQGAIAGFPPNPVEERFLGNDWLRATGAAFYPASWLMASREERCGFLVRSASRRRGKMFRARLSELESTLPRWLATPLELQGPAFTQKLRRRMELARPI
jgi:hypothetical protein